MYTGMKVDLVYILVVIIIVIIIIISVISISASNIRIIIIIIIIIMIIIIISISISIITDMGLIFAGDLSQTVSTYWCTKAKHNAGKWKKVMDNQPY